ncbi:uncharacterized protein LOC128725062 [Anopheles nili]|uniref:uncharacterized protein LOC128725062 n=1 Tax=Anopheles nili TaxID=185578 RepID=UPI00237AF71A|nr:uncharacterized protein LOC128725062 [Anopheles nili]
MNPPSVFGWWLVLLLAACTSAKSSTVVSESNDSQNCPAVNDVNPQQCCRSFLDLHRGIIECLPPPGRTGQSCIVLCLLQNYRTYRLFTSMPLSVSSIITIAPKLITHFDRCQSGLLDFFAGNTFEGDFRTILCDERVNGFLECMVKHWFQDCMGFDSENSKCVELQSAVKASNCSIGSIFALKPRN